MNILLFDTETTGFGRRDKIIELGGLQVTDGKIVGELSEQLNPKIPLPDFITELTGITNKDLFNQPSFFEYLPKLTVFFGGADILIAHNAVFDVRMLVQELNRLRDVTDLASNFPMPPRTICTMNTYKPLFMGKKMKMALLYERIMGEPLVQTHRALDDCRAMYKFLAKDNFFEKLEASKLQTELPMEEKNIEPNTET